MQTNLRILANPYKTKTYNPKMQRNKTTKDYAMKTSIITPHALFSNMRAATRARVAARMFFHYHGCMDFYGSLIVWSLMDSVAWSSICGFLLACFCAEDGLRVARPAPRTKTNKQTPHNSVKMLVSGCLLLRGVRVARRATRTPQP